MRHKKRHIYFLVPLQERKHNTYQPVDEKTPLLIIIINKLSDRQTERTLDTKYTNTTVKPFPLTTTYFLTSQQDGETNKKKEKKNRLECNDLISLCC